MRLELWLKTHIEKLLGPLFELNKAEDITGIARGIAFQLIEALGVLERTKIAAEMKDLDQPSRASLRKYGVRFGAYHIYFPALLKPAARSLASLLWALKQDNVDLSALSGAQHLAGSGRTSFPVDKQLARDAYRVLGYRQCGERAVRVDILERLADLIRPALAWRETSPGEKPAGAFDGRGFVVTQAMTSLTGSAGEDFASILRALGYRMERRPPLPPKPVAVEAAAPETPAVESAAETPAEAVTEAPAETATEAPAEAEPAKAEAALPVSGEPAPSAALLPEVLPAPAAREEAPAVIEAQPEPAAPVEAPAAEVPQEQVPQEQAPQEQTAADTTAVPAVVSEAAPSDANVAQAAAEAATPELVEVWRPGGRSEERRPRHDRNRHRQASHRQAIHGQANHGQANHGQANHGQANHGQDGAQPQAASGEPGQGERQADKQGEKREHHRRGRRHRGFPQAARGRAGRGFSTGDRRTGRHRATIRRARGQGLAARAL